jgi:hypothetical protein
MPRLYCAEHGKEHEFRCQEEQENYRWLGETVLIARGQLISAPWRCDRCHAPLRRCHKAWLVTAFPHSATAGMGDYDFAVEKQYFNMTLAEVKVYGAECQTVYSRLNERLPTSRSDMPITAEQLKSLVVLQTATTPASFSSQPSSGRNGPRSSEIPKREGWP